MTAANRVLLLTLSERTSARGTRYFAGYMGRASVVMFLDDERDKHGNPRWSLFVSTPEPRSAEREESAPTNSTAREGHAGGARGPGWSGQRYRRPSPEPAAVPVEQFDDGLAGIGR